jgi:tRNA(Leu) C34 or U34 (ribose-2'-O)-methylase TrmL
VATHAAQALAERGATPPADVLAEAVARHDPAPEGLLRALASAAPASPAVIEAARAGVDAALDHLADPATLRALLAGEHRVVAAWHLARLGESTAALANDPDPRVRAAAARGLSADHPALATLTADPDPGVRWTAQRALQGDFADLDARLGPHARSDAPSARPPYGLSPDDAIAPVPRLHAALALCHTRIDVNLGVAVRSAEAAGLEAVYLVGRGDLFRTPARGTDMVIPVHAVADAAALVRVAREKGYQIVGLQQTPRSVPYHRADYPPCPLFVVGAEDTGLPPALRTAADLLVEIPMYGVIDSLNVAASATCVMFHWRAHREG